MLIVNVMFYLQGEEAEQRKIKSTWFSKHKIHPGKGFQSPKLSVHAKTVVAIRKVLEMRSPRSSSPSKTASALLLYKPHEETKAAL